MEQKNKGEKDPLSSPILNFKLQKFKFKNSQETLNLGCYKRKFFSLSTLKNIQQDKEKDGRSRENK